LYNIMTRLKIGVIGSGGRGGLARHAHGEDKGGQVVACCDISATTLEKNREFFGDDIFTTSNYHQLLEQDLDAVFITTPDFLHEEMAVAALQAGKAVYLEKPMTITTEGCDRVLKAAIQTGSKLYVGHNMRHMPFVLKMKQLIDDGVIGNVKGIWCRHFVGHGGDYYFKDWHAESRYSTGLLLQKGAHDLDVIHWLGGSYSERVVALGGLSVYGDNGRVEETPGPRSRGPVIDSEYYWPPSQHPNMNSRIDVEDISQMTMRLQNGAFATYSQCHFTPDYWRNYTVIGDAGRMENFGNGEDGTHIKVWNTRKGGNDAPDEVHMVERPKGGHGGADPRIVAEFLRFVREGGPTYTSPLAARFSVAAGCAATDSIRSDGAPQTVPDVPLEWWSYFNEQFQNRAQHEEPVLNGSRNGHPILADSLS
jgi:predicted dehydrogenase